MTSEFKVGDRVGAVQAVREQYEAFGGTHPLYGHVVNVRGQSLVWVRDHSWRRVGFARLGT